MEPDFFIIQDIPYSTAISAISYNPYRKQMISTYRSNGRRYMYLDVWPEELDMVISQALKNKQGESSLGATHYEKIREEKSFK